MLHGTRGKVNALEREDRRFPKVISIGEKCLPNGVNTKGVSWEGREGVLVLRVTWDGRHLDCGRRASLVVVGGAAT